jgi:hypothetical protein
MESDAAQVRSSMAMFTPDGGSRAALRLLIDSGYIRGSFVDSAALVPRFAYLAQVLAMHETMHLCTSSIARRHDRCASFLVQVLSRADSQVAANMGTVLPLDGCYRGPLWVI